MRVLLDTHILLWALTDDPRLPSKARVLIENEENEIFYSSVAPWEVEIKRLAHPTALTVCAEEVVSFCSESGFQSLPVRDGHAYLLKQLHRDEKAPPHKDPFDRIMICQAVTEGMIFVTHDELLAGYDEPCVFVV